MLQLTVEAEQKVQKARDLLEDIVEKNKGMFYMSLVVSETPTFQKFSLLS